MNSKLWIRKALSSCLMVAIIATYSMVALANDSKAAGELLVSGSGDAAVTVDGQAAQSGRTIFSGSTFSTSENASATINLGTAGNLQLTPNSTVTLNFDSKTISANLTAGSLSVLQSANAVSVNGEMFNAGQVATTGADDNDNNKKKKGGAAWWVFALVIGGAAAVLVGVVAQDNDYQVGGSGVVVSPTR